MKSLLDYLLHREEKGFAFEDFLHDNYYIVNDSYDITDADEYRFETLLRSYSIEKFIEALKNRFSFDIILYKYGTLRNEDGNQYYECVIYFSDLFDFNNSDFKSICNLYNVYQSSKTVIGDKIEVIFKQKITKDVTDKVYKENNYLYHITKRNKLDKILKFGLQPKSQSKKAYHPERVYLLSENIPCNTLKNYKKQLDGDVILKIDLSKSVDRKLTLHEDPDTKGVAAYYCEDIIVPSSINIVGPVEKFLMKIFK